MTGINIAEKLLGKKQHTLKHTAPITLPFDGEGDYLLLSGDCDWQLGKPTGGKLRTMYYRILDLWDYLLYDYCYVDEAREIVPIKREPESITEAVGMIRELIPTDDVSIWRHKKPDAVSQH